MAGNLIACVYRYDPAPGGRSSALGCQAPQDGTARAAPALQPAQGVVAAEQVILVEGKCAQALIEAGRCDHGDARCQRAGRQDRLVTAGRQSRAHLAGSGQTGIRLCRGRLAGGCSWRGHLLRDSASARCQVGRLGCRGRLGRGTSMSRASSPLGRASRCSPSTTTRAPSGHLGATGA